MLYPGLTSITFRKLTIDQIIQLCQENQIKGIEWGGDVHVPPGELALAESVRKKTTAAGLTVCAYGSYYRCDDDPQPFSAVLDSAVALQAPVIRVWAGRKGSADATAAERQQVVSALKRATTLATEKDITIALEYHGNTLTDTQASAHQLLQEVGMPELKLYWQVRTGANDLQENLVELDAAIPHLSHVHCFHWGDQGYQSRLPLAEGFDDWVTYVQRLQSLDTDRYVTLEFVKDDSIEQFQADAATLNRLLHPTSNS